MRAKRLVPAILTPAVRPGMAWESDLQAPGADGSNVSIPPMVSYGVSPAHEVTGNDTPKLGVGTADPAFHGG